MDIERTLCSTIVSTGKIEEAISRGIRPEHFADTECQTLFLYVQDHLRKYKQVPTFEAVKDEIPSFEWVHSSDSLPYLIDRFIRLVKWRKAQEYVESLARACDDPERAMDIDQEFFEASRELAMVVPSTKVARFSDMEKRIKDYERRRTLGIPIGIPYQFFPRITAMTGGIQPHHFVVVAAFSGVGKSTFLHATAFGAYLADKTPLIISLEEDHDAILSRIDAMAAGLNYNHLLKLELPEPEIERWQTKAAEILSGDHDIPIIDDIGGCTPTRVYAEMVRHSPDLVIVDYLSLMQPSSGTRGISMWQSITEITRELKQNARTLKIPIVAAAQTNRSGAREGAQMDNVGYSQSIVQDPDVVIGLFQDDDMERDNEMEIRINKNRRGPLGRFIARWDHEITTYTEMGAERFVRQPTAPPRPRPRPNPRG